MKVTFDPAVPLATELKYPILLRREDDGTILLATSPSSGRVLVSKDVMSIGTAVSIDRERRDGRSWQPLRGKLIFENNYEGRAGQ